MGGGPARGQVLRLRPDNNEGSPHHSSHDLCLLLFDVSRLCLRTPLTLFVFVFLFCHAMPHSVSIHSSPSSFPLSPLPLSLQRLKRYEEYRQVHAPIEDTRFAFWRGVEGRGCQVMGGRTFQLINTTPSKNQEALPLQTVYRYVTNL